MVIKLRSLIAQLRHSDPLRVEAETDEEKAENERQKEVVRRRLEAVSKQLLELTRDVYWRQS